MQGKRGTREYDEWFLRYVPLELDKKKTSKDDKPRTGAKKSAVKNNKTKAKSKPNKKKTMKKKFRPFFINIF